MATLNRVSRGETYAGYTDLEVVTDSVNRGAVFKFLTKPWDDKLLLDQVRDAFRRYRPSNAAA